MSEQKNKRIIDIILVEDDEFLRDVYATKLQYSEFKDSHVVAKNGAEALEALKEVTPRLIFLDIFMPKLDGLDTLRAIRALPEYDKVAIIMLTNFGEPEYKARCIRLGATDFVVKVSVTPGEVLKKMERFFPGGPLTKDQQHGKAEVQWYSAFDEFGDTLEEGVADTVIRPDRIERYHTPTSDGELHNEKETKDPPQEEDPQMVRRAYGSKEDL